MEHLWKSSIKDEYDRYVEGISDDPLNFLSGPDYYYELLKHIIFVMNYIFSGMSGHPERRGRATPIFKQKFKLLKKATKVEYCFNFFLNRVAYSLKKNNEFFRHAGLP